MAKGFNGGIIGTRNLTTGGAGGVATGIWSINEVQIAKLATLWPVDGLVVFSVVRAFTESQVWTVPAGVTSVDYLVVAGGGGGGGGVPSPGANGGAGGAGGFRSGTAFPVTPAANYSVTVGAGGSAGIGGTSPGSGGIGGTGSDSVFASITALGGGYGAAGAVAGGNVGSGGGGAGGGGGVNYAAGNGTP